MKAGDKIEYITHYKDGSGNIINNWKKGILVGFTEYKIVINNGSDDVYKGYNDVRSA